MNEKKSNQEERRDEDTLKDERLESRPSTEEKERPTPLPQPRTRPFFVLEFGRILHRNRFINFGLMYSVNLTVMLAVGTFLSVADFGSRLEVFLGFVLSYTLLEALFQRYVIVRHLPLALKTFGLLFFLVYLMLLYGLDTWGWTGVSVFSNETELIVFTASMIVVRFIVISGMRRLRDRGNLLGHR